MKKLPFLLAFFMILSLILGSGITITAAPDDGVNLALGKTATASSNTTGNAPGNAVDGNTSTTRWVSSNSDPQWLRVDLGGVYTVSRVILDWHNSNYGTKYLIETSIDGTGWTVVSDRFFVDLPVTNSTHRIDDIFFDAIEARYVRVNGLTRSGSYSLWEFEIYGPYNTAGGKTAPVSSGSGAALTDGNIGTAWVSAGKDGEYFGVDLGAVLRVGSVKINWGADYASAYTVRVSDNGTTWFDAYSTSNGKGGAETINLAPLTATRYAKQDGVVDPRNIPAGQTPDGFRDVSLGYINARYVRVYPQAGPGNSYSVNELETYGNPWKSAPDITDTGALSQAIVLDSGWMLARAPDVTDTPAAVSSPGYNTGGGAWIKAVVPGTALTSYFKAGIIDDPYYSDNIYKLSQWYFNVDYWYRNEFFLPQDFGGNRVVLNLEAVNWLSDVYVNGQKAGITVGVFKSEEYDVTEYLVPGKLNTIAINVHIFQTMTASGSRFDQLQMLPHYQSSGGWDWIPVIPGRNVGVTGNVTLTTRNSVAIMKPFIKTDLPWTPPPYNVDLPATLPEADVSSADVSVDLELVNSGSRSVTGVIKGVINPGNIAFQQSVTIPANRATKVSFSPSQFPALHINNPRLWWPNGYGEQFLYDIDLSYEINGVVSDQKSFKFGIRELGYWWKDGTRNWVYIFGDATAYNEDMNAWNLQLFCNGVKIMCKGGNWGMPDAMLRWGPEEYDTAVRLHAEENFTMIRAWIGTTDNKWFYDACDKYGILVFTDFWVHGNNMTELTGPFIENARAKVERIRNHPSVALYCGGNEWTPWGLLDNEPSGPGWAPGPSSTAVLPALCRELDPTRLYITESNAQPVRGGITYRANDPRWYFDRVTRSPGFTTEIGTAVVPNYESMKAMMEEAYWWPSGDALRPFDKNINYMWQIHDLGGEGGGNKGAEDYISQVAKRFGATNGIEEFCIKAQMLNYETNRAMFEGWNNQLFNHASGILLWMSQSAWPSTIWQTYDWYFDVNGAFHGCKKACEPIHIQYDSWNRIIKVINNSSKPLQNVTAKIEIYNLNGTLFRSYQDTLTAPSAVATQVRNINSDLTNTSLSMVHFIKLILTGADGNVLSENFYWDTRQTNNDNRTRYISYSGSAGIDTLPQVPLDGFILESATTGGVTKMKVELTNNTSTVAVFTRLKVMKGLTEERVLPAYYDDNYFGMLPGETRTINIEFAAKDTGAFDPVLRMEGFNTVSAVITENGSASYDWELTSKAQLSKDAARDSVDVMATVRNNTGAVGNVNVYAAAYDGAGKLLSIASMEIAVPAHDSKSTVWFCTMDVFGNADVCKVKVFAWDPLTYVPMCEASTPVIMPAGTY